MNIKSKTKKKDKENNTCKGHFYNSGQQAAI